MLSPSTRADPVGADVALADEEGLGEAVRCGLGRIGDLQAERRAVAEQPDELLGLVRGGDDQDLADPGQHQRRQRVVDHRLVVDRHQLLADRVGDRVESAAGATGQDDALHADSMTHHRTRRATPCTQDPQVTYRIRKIVHRRCRGPRLVLRCGVLADQVGSHAAGDISGCNGAVRPRQWQWQWRMGKHTVSLQTPRATLDAHRRPLARPVLPARHRLRASTSVVISFSTLLAGLVRERWELFETRAEILDTVEVAGPLIVLTWLVASVFAGGYASTLFEAGTDEFRRVGHGQPRAGRPGRRRLLPARLPALARLLLRRLRPRHLGLLLGRLALRRLVHTARSLGAAAAQRARSSAAASGSTRSPR